MSKKTEWNFKKVALSVAGTFATVALVVGTVGCVQAVTKSKQSKCEHVWNDGTVTQEATCEGEGVLTYECKECKLEKAEVIAAKGHTEEAFAKIDANCDKKGYTDGKICIVCEKVTMSASEIPALGHIEVIDKAKAATCEQTGLTEGKHCERCEAVLVVQEVIEKRSHSVVGIPGREATCERTGLTNGAECEYCGTVYAEREEIPAKGHTLTAVTGQAATCLDMGWNAYQECTVCGYTTIEYIEALGHDFYNSVCQTCGYAKSSVHTCIYDRITRIEPTCEVDGLVVYTCECGESQETVLPKTGHDYESEVTTAAECEVTGTLSYFCKNCEAMYEEDIPALVHEWVEGIEKAATCTTDGVLVTSCTKCTESYDTAIPAFGHTPDTGTITQVVSCTQDGIKEFRCLTCNTVTSTETTDKLGHDYKAVVSKEGDCITNEVSTFTCARCEDSYEKVTAEAQGHSFGEDGICSVCGENIALDGLTMMNGAYVAVEETNKYPDLRFEATATQELQSSLKENQQLGMIFADYNDVFNLSEKTSATDWANALTETEKTFTFVSASALEEGGEKITASLWNIAYENVDTQYVAIPVVQSVYGTDGVDYQYAYNVADLWQSAARSATQVASAALNAYAQGVPFDNATVTALKDIIDISVDVWCDLEEPIFDGSTYIVDTAQMEAGYDYTLESGAATLSVSSKWQSGDESGYIDDIGSVRITAVVEDNTYFDLTFNVDDDGNWLFDITPKAVGASEVTFYVCGVAYTTTITIK